jgi:uncharacterized protein (DUF2235 family)
MNRNIIIAFDGTWDTPKSKTNVERLKDAALNNDQQKVWYHPGVGTSTLTWIRGGLFGYGLSKNIKEAYGFLADKYNEGDHLFIFGFSRGAFSARSLAGLIRKCHILKDRKDVDDAYRLYQKKDLSPDTPEMETFRKEHSQPWDPEIHFVGVWDTVGTLGVPLSWGLFRRSKYEFHDTKLNSYVKNAYHAVAIDEQRKDFDVTLWTETNPATTCEQRLFIGAHSNVGGGYENDALCTIPFYWMLGKAVGCGLLLGEGNTLEHFTYADDAMLGKITDSYAECFKGVYKMFSKRFIRQFDLGVNVVLDETVPKRVETDSSYRPMNIGNYT